MGNEEDLELDFGAHLSDSENDHANHAQGSNGSALASAKLSNKKKEALSQVPCKFFRSNGCSAGNACPFAHVTPGEGQGKAVCQWFLKGSCRFGHRCALAHILPGQPMSMDRKNKRAAQHQLQNQTNGISQTNNSKYPPKIPIDPRQMSSQEMAMVAGHANFTGDAGSSARPVFASSSTYKDGDLVFGIPDDLQPSHDQHFTGLQSFSPIRPDWHNRLGQSSTDSDARLLSQESTLDGYAAPGLATSPIPVQAFGTSPFSRPGSHSVFFSADQPEARSFGHTSRHADATQKAWLDDEQDEGEDVNGEDFLPSSLSDLLTPAELERRKRNMLGSEKISLTGAVPQSMPARGSNIGQSLGTARMDRGWGHDDSLDHRDPPPSSLMAARDRDIGGNARLGASNTSTGFLSSHLRRQRAAQLSSRGEETPNELDSYSPGAQAIMTHAPGQSLPQGLAAGLSRLHIRTDAKDDFRRSQHVSDNGTNVGAIGTRSNVDELGPIAPSSVLGARYTPLLSTRSSAYSVSTSIDAPTGSWQASPHRGTEGGIAIPISPSSIEKPLGSRLVSHGPSSAKHQHPGVNRVRTATPSAVGSSPLALPTSGGEVDDAIFELE